MGEANDATRVAAVESMIWHLARKRFRGRDEATLDAVVQDVRGHLVTECLPKFDAGRGVKESTYLHACIRRRLGALARNERRTRSHEPLPASLAARDRRGDEAVYRLADAVTARPEEFLTDRQAKVLRALLEPTLETRQELAARLNTDTKALSAMLGRIRRRLVALLEDVPIP